VLGAGVAISCAPYFSRIPSIPSWAAPIVH
jgi:hypothetical protein